MSTCWRVVCVAISGGSSGMLGGGSGIVAHSTLRWMYAPRWIGELWLVYAWVARKPSCVKRPARFVASRSTRVRLVPNDPDTPYSGAVVAFTNVNGAVIS